MTTSAAEASADASARHLGRVLGRRWTLDEVLGRGGMATVYGATHANGRRAAIKVLDDTLAGVGAARARFLAESRAANRVSHPGVVDILDEGEESDGTIYLVMERLVGETLADLRVSCGGSIRWAELAPLADQMLEVLAVAHDHGIIHRDVKPANIFLTRDGKVKLLDFGVAKLSSASVHPATGAGAVLGTPGFMAPEQARGEEVDGRADVFSSGVTLWLSLVGEMPAERSTTSERREPPPGTPATVRAALARALEESPENRWPNARAFRTALRDGLLTRATGGTTLEEGASSRHPARSAPAGRSWWLATGLAVMGAAAPVLAGRGLLRMRSAQVVASAPAGSAFPPAAQPPGAPSAAVTGARAAESAAPGATRTATAPPLPAPTPAAPPKVSRVLAPRAPSSTRPTEAPPGDAILDRWK